MIILSKLSALSVLEEDLRSKMCPSSKANLSAAGSPKLQKNNPQVISLKLLLFKVQVFYVVFFFFWANGKGRYLDKDKDGDGDADEERCGKNEKKNVEGFLLLLGIYIPKEVKSNLTRRPNLGNRNK